MPTYDYQCPECDTLFEVVHQIHDASPQCPCCGGEARPIILRAPAFHGAMAQGRELAVRSLPECGKGCRCCP